MQCNDHDVTGTVKTTQSPSSNRRHGRLRCALNMKTSERGAYYDNSGRLPAVPTGASPMRVGGRSFKSESQNRDTRINETMGADDNIPHEDLAL